jgi:uridine kinase
MGVVSTPSTSWPADIAAAIVAGIAAREVPRRTMVAIDGPDASGKTTFAADLAEALRLAGTEPVVIHVDDFMHPPAIRHRRGRSSPEGYLDDSYDYAALTRHVLDPETSANPSTVVIVEGLFLLRNELASWWDFSVFLDVTPEVALRRKELRDGLSLGDADDLTNRYVEGQRLYRDRYAPQMRATWMITDPA